VRCECAKNRERGHNDKVIIHRMLESHQTRVAVKKNDQKNHLGFLKKRPLKTNNKTNQKPTLYFSFEKSTRKYKIK